MTPERIAWFWSRTAPGPGGCLLWTGALTDGYGTFANRPAHRVAYWLGTGIWPGELWCLHSCDVPACVNPKHLRAGTLAENTADRVRRNFRWTARGNPPPESTFAGWMRRARKSLGMRQADIAARIGADLQVISSIETGKRTPPPMVRQAIRRALSPSPKSAHS